MSRIDNHTLILLFGGYNQRAVVAFARTLRLHGLPYAIVARNADDPLLKTELATDKDFVRTSAALSPGALRVIFRHFRQNTDFSRFWVAPSTEFLNRRLLEERDYLEQEKCILPLVDQQLYSRVSDKKSFGDLCRAAGIRVPEESDTPLSGAFPIVAKPRTYAGANGGIYTPVIISTEDGLREFERNHRREDFYFQEFVEGRSFYLLYYRYRNGKLIKLSQENLVQRKGGKNMVAARLSDVHQSDWSNKYENLLAELGFHGLVMIEVKIDGKKSYMIEANPRLWGPSQLFVDAGTNLFEHLLMDYGLLPSTLLTAPASAPESTRYAWMAGYWNDRGHDFYGTTKEDFEADLAAWVAADVYCRADTLAIFKSELHDFD